MNSYRKIVICPKGCEPQDFIDPLTAAINAQAMSDSGRVIESIEFHGTSGAPEVFSSAKGHFSNRNIKSFVLGRTVLSKVIV